MVSSDIQIDVSDFVEAPEGQTLGFSDEKQQANFELGVSMVIHSWEILNIAVVNGWGGPRSSDKRDWISDIVVDLFKGPVVDIELIEETILNAMLDEFDVNVEDESSLPIAAKVIGIYRQVASGDYSTVRSMYEQWKQKGTQKEQYQVQIQEDPENPGVSDNDDDDDDEEDDEVELVAEQMDIDAPQEPQGPIVDDDGFELVQKKGRRRH